MGRVRPLTRYTGVYEGSSPKPLWPVTQPRSQSVAYDGLCRTRSCGPRTVGTAVKLLHTGTVDDDADSSDEFNDGPAHQSSADEELPERTHPVVRGSMPSLDAFVKIQRHLASIDFSAIRAAQHAIQQADAFQKIIATQDAIAKSFAQSVDFSRLTEAHHALTETGVTVQAMAAQQRWAESLANSIDLTALNNALASSAALDSFARTSEAFNQSLREQTEFLARIAEAVTIKLPAIDIPGLREALDRWIPANPRRGRTRCRRGDRSR